MPQTANFTGVGISPTVSSAENRDSGDVVRVTFSEPMLLDSNLTSVLSYTLTPATGSVSRTIESVVPEVDASNPRYVDLQLSGKLTKGTSNYTITVSTSVTDVAGNPLDAANNSVVFDGIGLVVIPIGVLSIEEHIKSDWSSFNIPNITALKKTLLDVSISDSAAGTPERSLLAIAKQSPFYSLVRGLNAELDNLNEVYPEYRQHIQTLIQVLEKEFSRLLIYIDELSQVNVSQNYRDLLKSYLNVSPDSLVGMLYIIVVIAAIKTI